MYDHLKSDGSFRVTLYYISHTSITPILISYLVIYFFFTFRSHCYRYLHTALSATRKDICKNMRPKRMYQKLYNNNITFFGYSIFGVIYPSGARDDSIGSRFTFTDNKPDSRGSTVYMNTIILLLLYSYQHIFRRASEYWTRAVLSELGESNFTYAIGHRIYILLSRKNN